MRAAACGADAATTDREEIPVLVNAVILAGAPNTGALREMDPAPNEALIPIGGRPMIQYVIDGLRQSQQIGRILVVSPPGELEPHVSGENLEFVPNRGHIVENALTALERLPTHEKCLICSSDIPFINGQVIDGLLDLCSRREADLYYPIIERSEAERYAPGVKRTYVHLREGVYTGGNIFMVNPDIAPRLAPKVRQFLDYRKDPFKMAGLLGWSFVLKLFFKLLRMGELEQHLSRLWEIQGAVVVCPYPEVGIDVDKPSDLQLARAALGGNPRSVTG